MDVRAQPGCPQIISCLRFSPAFGEARARENPDWDAGIAGLISCVNACHGYGEVRSEKSNYY